MTDKLAKILEISGSRVKTESHSCERISDRSTSRIKRLKTLLCIAILYLATQLAGGWMVRKDRPRQDPSVFPILPCVLVARDRTGYVGEITVYIWYFTGVLQIGKTLLWIV